MGVQTSNVVLRGFHFGTKNANEQIDHESHYKSCANSCFPQGK